MGGKPLHAVHIHLPLTIEIAVNWWLNSAKGLHIYVKIEITVNDDKGMLFILVFGLPPLGPPDDPTRAVLFCIALAEIFKSMGMIGRFGVMTGRSYCSVRVSMKRMEYTVLGDCVNLSSSSRSTGRPWRST
jgi:hypothetical protein